MNYRGATIICSDEDPGRCCVILASGVTQYCDNMAAAQAFVDAVNNNDDDGYPD